MITHLHRFCNSDSITHTYKSLPIHFTYLIYVEAAVAKVSQMAVDSATPDQILDEVKRVQVSLNLSGEYRYHILLCGLFNKERNIIKNWNKYEKTFLDLIALDGKIGIK